MLAAIFVLLLAVPLPFGIGTKAQHAYADVNDLTLPPATEWAAPSGAPTAPGNTFGVTFTSPPATVPVNAPAIAEWNKTVKPNESFTMSGVRFTTLTGSAAGSDTTVWIWADTPSGGVLTQAQITSVSDSIIQAIVPAAVPFGMYLVWVENANGASSPITINRPEPTWLGPFGNKAAPGESKRVFGNNLSSNHGTTSAYVYLQPAAGGSFQAVTVTSVEPYAVQFTVPSSLAAGSYKVYVHSGHGGAYGWSTPLTLTVASSWVRGASETVVAPVGSGGDDTANIQNAINTQTANTNGGTVRLQAGIYTLKNQLNLLTNVRLIGAGKTATTINIDPTNMHPTGIAISGAHTTLDSFKLVQKVGPNQPQYGPIKTDFPGPFADIRLLNLDINADARTKGGTVDLRTSGGEVANSDFSRELTMSGTDFWVHDNNFYGGPYGGVNVLETEAATYTDGNNLLMEHNHFETRDWPTNASGSTNYLNFVTADDLQYKVWAKRAFYTAPQFGSVENSYIAWNTGTNLAVDDNRGETILYHGIPSKWYAQVASNSGTTLTINTSGLIDGQARNVDQMPASSTVPNDLVHGTLDNQAYAVIMNGTGMGQARKVISHTSTTITVDKAWRIAPAADSKITLTFLSKNAVVYKNNINAFPANYDLYYSASTGPDADGNAWNFSAEGNTTNHTYGGRVLGGYSTGPGYWNEQRDEIANNTYHSGMNIVAWAFNGFDFLGPSVLGSYFRGGTATITSAQNGGASGPPALLNSQISPYEGTEINAGTNAITASGFEGMTGSGSTLGARADQWTQVTFRNNTLAVQNNTNVSYTARPVEIRKDSQPIFITNSYTGATPVYVKTNLSTLVDRPTPLLRVAQFKGAVGATFSTSAIPIANTGIASMTWTVSASQPWITAAVGAGSTLAAEQASGQLNVSVSSAGKAQGTYTGSVTLTSSAGQTAVVGVRMILGTGGGGGDTQAPTAPTNLASPSKTSTTVNLTWTASTDNVGVTGYDIYRGATLAGSVNGTTTTFTDTGLTASTAYSYTVKAKDAALNVSPASTTLSVTTNALPADTQAPTAPTNLASPSKTSTTVNLTWTASTDNVGVTGYDIYRGATLAGSVSGGATTSYTATGLTASTAYSFTVKAKDAANNISAASTALLVTTNAASGGTGTGLTGEYYNNIDFVGLTNTRVDPQINFDWGTAVPPGSNIVGTDTYSVRWTGQIEAPVSGTYTITTTSDDGVKVWIDGTMVIDHYNDHPPTDRSGTITLAANTKYNIKIEYYNNQVGAVIKLYWAYTGQSQQLIPQSRLYP
ncbi:unnamed protein product [Aphanomyces euteiches]